MISKPQRVEAAHRASVAAQFAIAAKGKAWHDVLKRTPEALAETLDADPSIPAEALYIACRLKTPWAEAGAPLRVALETFRATYLALRGLLEPPPEPDVVPVNPARFGKRTFRKRPSMATRVKLSS